MSKSTGLIVMAVLALGVLASVPAEAATYYVAKTGNDSNPCTQAQPCLTIGKAKNLATSPGDIVQVGPGTYSESVTATASGLSGKKIIFRGHDGSGCPTVSIGDVNSRGKRPAPAASVRSFSVAANYVTVECFKVTGGSGVGSAFGTSGNSRNNVDFFDNVVDASATPGDPGNAFVTWPSNLSSAADLPHHITFARNYNYMTGMGYIIKANNVVVRDNESERLQNQGDGDHVQLWGDTHLYENNYFHGNRKADAPNAHSDCWQTWNIGNTANWQLDVAKNITINGNTCLQVDETIITANQMSDPSLFENWTVTNNILAEPRIGGSAGGGGFGSTRNVLFYHNTLWNAMIGFGRPDSTIFTTGEAKNNIVCSWCLVINSSKATITQSNNLASDSPGFVNTSGDNFRLASSSPAINKAGALSNLSTLLQSVLSVDRDNKNRDASPDLGAFEFGGTTTSQRPQPPTNLQVLVQ